MRPERPPLDPESRERERLATFLAIALVLLFGGGFVLFLIVISFGYFLMVIMVAGGVAAFVGLHYLIWGRSGPPDDNSES